MAQPGLVLASPAPAGPAPDALGVGCAGLDQADQQATDLRERVADHARAAGADPLFSAWALLAASQARASIDKVMWAYQALAKSGPGSDPAPPRPAADTLTQLETEIESDYGKNPVLDECDTLDAARDYLTAEHGDQPECTDDLPAQAVRAAEAIVGEAAEHHVILDELRVLFPDWDIEYCEQMRGWIAKRKGATIWENSPLFLRIALTRIEQKRKDA